MLPEEVLPDEVLPEEVLPEDVLPEEVLPEEVLPEEFNLDTAELRALRVLGPAIPSTVSPFAFWKFLSALRVFSPKETSRAPP